MRTCYVCGQEVREDDPEVVRAHELIESVTFSGTEIIEGKGHVFHREHYPGGPRFRLAN